MAPIYRSERTALSISGEAGAGGYLEYISAIDDSGGAPTTLTAAHVAGSKVLAVASSAGYTADDYVQIGTTASSNAEVRRVVSVSGNNIYLDYPLGFYHVNGDTVDEKAATGITGTSFSTFLPGVYQTVTLPDPVPEITPYYLLGTSSNRNFYTTYRGKQTLAGSLPNFILLNGYPMRFPIGTVYTIGTDSGTGGSTLNAATFVGQRTIPVTDGTGYANGDYVQIGGDATLNAEIRQIISGASGAGAQTFVLNYPLMLPHNNTLGVGWDTLNEVTSPYTHSITETVGLDSMTWHVLFRDSDGTTANDFIRRYVGGKVNRATFSADEAGMLQMSFDEIQFLDLLHNQASSGGSAMVKYTGVFIAPTGIGGDMPHTGGVLGTPSFPVTEPYYFSQGAITYFGIEFARIRNFRLEVNNNLEPRYYIRNIATERTPSEIQEQRREYRLSCTVALPDSFSASATTRTLFKELLLEGNYGSGQQGFAITMVFTRGTNDTITFTIPSDGVAATGGDEQGAFIVRAPHNITQDNPLQAEVEMIFRNLGVTIVDSVGVYP